MPIYLIVTYSLSCCLRIEVIIATRDVVHSTTKVTNIFTNILRTLSQNPLLVMVFLVFPNVYVAFPSFFVAFPSVFVAFPSVFVCPLLTWRHFVLANLSLGPVLCIKLSYLAWVAVLDRAHRTCCRGCQGNTVCTKLNVTTAQTPAKTKTNKEFQWSVFTCNVH